MTIVQIEWIDSFRVYGWKMRSDVATPDDLIVTSVGYLIDESEETVTISTSFCPASRKYIDPLTIPRVAIVGYWEIELE